MALVVCAGLIKQDAAEFVGRHVEIAVAPCSHCVEFREASCLHVVQIWSRIPIKHFEENLTQGDFTGGAED